MIFLSTISCSKVNYKVNIFKIIICLPGLLLAIKGEILRNLSICLIFKIKVIYQAECSVFCQAEKPALSLLKESQSEQNYLNIQISVEWCISTSLHIFAIHSFDT